MTDHPSDKGSRTEAIALAELVKRGYSVLTPFGSNHRYDLVVDQDGEFVRIQCKTGRYRDGTMIFNAISSSNGSKIKNQGYHGQADVFVVYCPDLDKIYWIPVEDLGGVQKPFLRVDPLKHQQANYNVRWAEQYELRPSSGKG